MVSSQKSFFNRSFLQSILADVIAAFSQLRSASPLYERLLPDIEGIWFYVVLAAHLGYSYVYSQRIHHYLYSLSSVVHLLFRITIRHMHYLRPSY